MSVFDNHFAELTDDVLTELGGMKIFWGSPFNWDEQKGASKQSIKEHTCWEFCITTDSTELCGTLYYFPTEFNGYVTEFARRGVTPKNKVIGWDDQYLSSWIMTANAKCRLDLEHAIMKLKNHLNK